MSAHEAAHAFTAKCLGDPTAYLGGQVTLDPIPHIRREPIGMLVLPIVSYLSSGWMIGWASAPYNPAWAAQYPRRAAVMAFAGPGANFVISLICWIGLKLGLSAGFFIPGDTGAGFRKPWDFGANGPTPFGRRVIESGVFSESPSGRF